MPEDFRNGIKRLIILPNQRLSRKIGRLLAFSHATPANPVTKQFYGRRSLRTFSAVTASSRRSLRSSVFMAPTSDHGGRVSEGRTRRWRNIHQRKRAVNPLRGLAKRKID